MWNPKTYSYEMPRCAVDGRPIHGNDVARLQDIKTYHSVAGYAPGAETNIDKGTAFIPAFLNLSRGDALMVPDNLEHMQLSADVYLATAGTGGLDYDVCFMYFDRKMTHLSNSVSAPLQNSDDAVDIEVKCNCFNIPDGTKYVFLGFKNNTSVILKVTYRYASIAVSAASEETDPELLKTVENPLLIVTGGTGGTPAPNLTPYLKKAGGTMTGTLDMGSQQLTNVSTLTASAANVVNLNVRDGADSSGRLDFLDETGGISSSIISDTSYLTIEPAGRKLSVNDANIINLAPPKSDFDAATKEYVDVMNNDLKNTLMNEFLTVAGGSVHGQIDMTNHIITGLHDPVEPQHASTKAYVDSAIANATGGGGSGKESQMDLYVDANLHRASLNFIDESLDTLPQGGVGIFDGGYLGLTTLNDSGTSVKIGSDTQSIQLWPGVSEGAGIDVTSVSAVNFQDRSGAPQGINCGSVSCGVVSATDVKCSAVATADDDMVNKKYFDDHVPTVPAQVRPIVKRGNFSAFYSGPVRSTGTSKILTVSFDSVPSTTDPLFLSVSITNFEFISSTGVELHYTINDGSENTLYKTTNNTAGSTNGALFYFDTLLSPSSTVKLDVYCTVGGSVIHSKRVSGDTLCARLEAVQSASTTTA